MKKSLVIALTTVLAILVAFAVLAAEHKFSGTLNIMVPFNAGSNTDRQIRFIQPYLEKHLGVKTVIVNAGGASGVIGTADFLKQ